MQEYYNQTLIDYFKVARNKVIVWVKPESYVKATSNFEDDQSDTNLEVLQENLPSPSYQKDDDDQYLLDSQNYRIVTSFR